MTTKFTVFTMPSCPDCKNAKSLLTREGKTFEERTEFTREELTNLVGPVRTLPQIVVEDEEGMFYIGGYKDLVRFIAKDGIEVRKLGV